MNPPPNTPPSRSMQIIEIFLYILAVLVLIPGLVAGMSLVTGASNLVENVLLPFNLTGGEIIHNMIAPTLKGFLINMGVIILVISIIVSALLLGIGRLVGHTAKLEARLARLEARSIENS